MELSEYLATLRRWWIAIVVIMLVGAGAGFAVARSSTPLYKATSSVFVSATSGDNVSDLVQGSTYTQNLMQSFAALAQMPSVLNPVIDQLGLDETPATLAKSISADNPLNTVLIEITVVDASPQTAAKVANAVAGSLATVAQSLSAKKSDNSPAITMKSVATASVPTAAFSPNTKLLVILWAAGALILAVVICLGHRMLDRRIQSERELASSGGLPLLGSIPVTKGLDATRPAALLAVSGLNGDAFRRLADHVLNSRPGGHVSSAVITSLHLGQGKTTVALGLAAALSERGIRVLIIDGDLRRSGASEGCGFGGHLGLADVLSGSCTVREAIVPWQGFDVLPAGSPCTEPGPIFTSGTMEELFEQVLSDYDFVLSDSAAIEPVADTFPLTRLTDGAIVVVPPNAVTAEEVLAAVASVDAVNGKVLGFVFNKAKPSNGRTGSYGSVHPARHTRAGRKETAAVPVHAPTTDVLS
ncbi:AAA family ATPase [Arthrobacter sp. LAPM80]|uniref:nucleotide-binding protein n=1 Tax=Arthrobacter sp. LAPM80 TaxID=3141788 RepID=UPI00398BA677